MTCRTFTHHVGTTKETEAIRVECAAHPRWIVDVPPQPKGADHTSRQIATATQAAHEAGEQ